MNNITHKQAEAVRYLFIIPLGLFGIMHFIVPSFFETMVPSFLSYRSFWVYFSGVALTAASLSIAAKVIPRLASFLLTLFVLSFILTVDIPGLFNESTRYFRLVSLLKDTSLLGGSLLYYFLFEQKKNTSKETHS